MKEHEREPGRDMERWWQCIREKAKRLGATVTDDEISFPGDDAETEANIKKLTIYGDVMWTEIFWAGH